MKLNAIRSLAGVTLLSAACLTVNATELTGFYVGGGLGSTYASKFCDYSLGMSCDDKDFAWKLLGGYQFNPMFGLEAFYANLGAFKTKGIANIPTTPAYAGVVEIKGKMSAFGLAATAGWPINEQLNLFGKVGYARGKTDYSASTSKIPVDLSNPSSNTNNLMAGAGVKFSFSQNLSVRAEWEFFKDMGKVSNTQAEDKSVVTTDVHLLSASLVYSF